MTVWWDPTETLANVLAQLRLYSNDVDEDRLAGLIPAAGEHIDNYLDRETPVEGPPPAPSLQAELERITIALYHGVDDDPIGRDVGLLTLHKQRWAVA